MSEQLLPESIRGSWYYIPDEGSLEEALSDKGQILWFGLDGTFRRHVLDDGEKQLAEDGDYTFDGKFLIIRGRNTDTFRVDPKASWFWFLEGKKKNRRLMRGLPDEADLGALTDTQSREIRILPIRVEVRHRWDEPADSIFDLVYKSSEGDERPVGVLFAEEHDDGQLWVGITPYVTGIDDQGWERIVRDSFLDIFLEAGDEVGVVTARRLDTGQSQVFNYQAE